MSPENRANETQRLVQTVVAACRIIRTNDEVGAVHLILNRRPTYQELVRVRECAALRNITLTVMGSGGVVLRRRVPSPAQDVGGPRE